MVEAQGADLRGHRARGANLQKMSSKQGARWCSYQCSGYKLQILTLTYFIFFQILLLGFWLLYPVSAWLADCSSLRWWWIGMTCWLLSFWLWRLCTQGGGTRRVVSKWAWGFIMFFLSPLLFSFILTIHWCIRCQACVKVSRSPRLHKGVAQGTDGWAWWHQIYKPKNCSSSRW